VLMAAGTGLRMSELFIEPPKQLIDNLLTLSKVVNDLERQDQRRIVNETVEAKRFQLEYQQRYSQRVCSDRDNPVAKIWHRAHLRLLRLGALLAVGCNPDEPLVTFDHYKWSETLIDHGVNVLAHKFNRGETGNNSDRYNQLALMKKVLKEYFLSTWNETTAKRYKRINEQMHQMRAIPRSSLQPLVMTYGCFKRDHNAADAFRQCINHFVLDGTIAKVSSDLTKQWNRTGEVYYVRNQFD
jgi:hypothetical protein